MGTYSFCTTAACNSAAPAVRVYLRASSSSGGALDVLDASSIFEIAVNGTARFFANRQSTVHVGSSFQFRNPPSFFAAEPSARDAYYETDALIDHLLWHKNTAPFVSYRLIQRLVTSNPSPRYVEAVAQAFTSGSFDGVTYSGAYGDLRATTAAIVLDREARSPVLDLDPSHGQLREPLLKVIGLLRSLEYTPADVGRQLELEGLLDTIGQQVFESPTVFNFFEPDYQPVGPIISSNLVSPEAQLGTAPFIVGLLNGISSLVRLGLTYCDDGFGSYYPDRRMGARFCDRAGWPEYQYYAGQRGGAIDKSSSDGTLSFRPSGGLDHASSREVVRELDLLLTGGRLSGSAASVIEAEHAKARDVGEYRNVTSHTCAHWRAENITSLADCAAAQAALGYVGGASPVDDGRARHAFVPRGCYYVRNSAVLFNSNGDNDGACSWGRPCLCRVRGSAHALERAMELFTASADFHVTNAAQPTEAPRRNSKVTTSLGRPYRAMVVLFLKGGADSWNLLVPHTGCMPGNATTNYEQYQRIRGGVALTFEDLLPVGAKAGTQPHSVCSTYGVHPQLPILKALYNDSQATFLTNVGTLVEPCAQPQ